MSVYRSKVDVWAVIVLALSLVICLASVALLLLSGSRAALVAVVLLAAVAGVGLIAHPVRYHITAEDLTIQAGVWKTRIPLAQIVRVARSSSLQHAPALSMDRLVVEYQGKPYSRPTILISPMRQEEFLRELAAAAKLEPKGGAWVHGIKDVKVS